MPFILQIVLENWEKSSRNVFARSQLACSIQSRRLQRGNRKFPRCNKDSTWNFFHGKTLTDQIEKGFVSLRANDDLWGKRVLFCRCRSQNETFVVWLQRDFVRRQKSWIQKSLLLPVTQRGSHLSLHNLSKVHPPGLWGTMRRKKLMWKSITI